MAEKIVKIAGDDWLIWKDAYSGGTKFHKLPKGTIIPIRNANAPTISGEINDAVNYIKRELKRKR
jgi:hypothetical protein